jgi:NAD(P)H-hydrate epimerase
VYVVLKGAYSCITTPEGKSFFNSTGNSGMAKGGSGDVLTGIILGLLAQQYMPEHAVLMGVYVHGLAGDLAAIESGFYSMIASDIIESLPKAFDQVD